MNLLELVEEQGLQPRKISASQGGEYHCPCPRCGGKDRFMLWPAVNRFWCRQCKASGDSIQFCRDFQNLSFPDALIKTQTNLPNLDFHPKTPLIRLPSCQWEEKAKIFTSNCHLRLMRDKTAIESIKHRGLSIDTVKNNQLGWNPIKAFHRRSDWGLEEKENRQWIFLPQGIVIPIFEDSAIRKIKIRKSEWQESDPFGKYYEIPGSSNAIPIFGNPSMEICVIVEAEFDAMLVVQETGDLCNCVALGGAQKRPQHSFRRWLLDRKLLLFALDFDDAGKREYSYWHDSYPNLEPWPVPEEKSPGDFFVNGGSLKMWISSGSKLLKR